MITWNHSSVPCSYWWWTEMKMSLTLLLTLLRLKSLCFYLKGLCATQYKSLSLGGDPPSYLVLWWRLDSHGAMTMLFLFIKSFLFWFAFYHPINHDGPSCAVKDYYAMPLWRWLQAIWINPLSKMTSELFFLYRYNYAVDYSFFVRLYYFVGFPESVF